MLNLAMVGCGGWSNPHSQAIQKMDDIRVVALADPVAAQTALIRQKYFPDAAEYDSLDKLLERPPVKLDGIILATPHTMHYAQIKQILEAGVNVMVEKPMVTNSEHAYDLWRTVKRTGKLLCIAFQAPCSREFRCLAQMRDSGRLGKISVVMGWVSQGWLNATKGKWRQDPALSGGGQMYDSGAHVFNSIMWLVNSPAVEVACFYDRRGTRVDIDGAAIIKFQNGALASVSIGGSGVHWDTEMRIQTDKLLIKTLPHGGMLEMTGPTGARIYPPIEDPEHPATGAPVHNFANAILGRDKLQSPVRYGVLLSAMMDALYESADTHQIVSVKPVPEDI